MKGKKEKYPTQEQRVAICLSTFRGGKPRSENTVVEKIDRILNEAVKRFSLIQSPISGKWNFIKKPNLPNVLKGKFFKSPDEAFKMAKKVGIPEEDIAIMEAVVVGTVGKEIATETQCPKGQRWCPKCMDCIDVRESPGTGVPPHDCHKCTGAGYASVGRIGGVSNLASVGRTG